MTSTTTTTTNNSNNNNINDNNDNNVNTITVLWATQSGRAKACARRTIRLLRSNYHHENNNNNTITSIRGMCSFDDFGADNFMSLGKQQQQQQPSNNDATGGNNKHLLLMFVSTTGDAEQCDTIHRTWSALLSRTLPHKTTFPHVPFALFCLGDRAYGPDAFCAAGRKLASRMVQLGGEAVCCLGYGDDGSLNGGVFGDLDFWLVKDFFPCLMERWGGSYNVNGGGSGGNGESSNTVAPINNHDLPYIVRIKKTCKQSCPENNNCNKNDDNNNNDASSSSSSSSLHEWQQKEYQRYYNNHFKYSCPATAYQYNTRCERIVVPDLQQSPNDNGSNNNNNNNHNPLDSFKSPLLGRVTVNERITANEWRQDTRHFKIHVTEPMMESNNNSNDTTTADADADADAPKKKKHNNPHPSTLPYLAGDVATIIPSNPPQLVSRFLSVLPPSISAIADDTLHIQYKQHKTNSHSSSGGGMNHPWPEQCTLRGLLTHCADIQSLPEREDLYALSKYCNSTYQEDSSRGRDQCEKLISLSETSGAALYGDYVIREKRNWVDVFYDFDSIRSCSGGGGGGGSSEMIVGGEEEGGGGGGSLLTVEHLLMLLPSIAPRHFSIASSPSFMIHQSSSSSSTTTETDNDPTTTIMGFELELCVAVVEGKTPFGRPYTGCCSNYLSSIPCKSKIVSDQYSSSAMNGNDIVRLWIRPGSFSKLPVDPLIKRPGEEEDLLTTNRFFKTPIMCIGAGTGVAPLRSLILEREAVRLTTLGHTTTVTTTISTLTSVNDDSVREEDRDNILVFGCRKKSMDYYYCDEWEKLMETKSLRLIPAFSRDQEHKLYVQRALREADGGVLIAQHILERNGAVYIAGGSKMARAVKDEIVEALGSVLEGGESDAKKLLNKLKRIGMFSIEAWS